MSGMGIERCRFGGGHVVASMGVWRGHIMAGVGIGWRGGCRFGRHLMAIMLGRMVFGEALTWRKLLAAGLMATGVALILL